MSSTVATVTLAFDGTDFDSDFTTFNITAAAAELTGAGDLTSDNLTITATNDAETFTMTDDGTITEGAEAGEVITVTLSGGTFVNPLSGGSWSLSNGPTGVTVGSAVWSSATEAFITLAGNRTVDYDANITNLQVTASSAEVNDQSGNTSVSTGVTFTAVSESATITHAGLTEGNLNTAAVTFTMTGETFADGSLSAGNFTLNNAPSGTTVNNVAWVSSTVATVTLAFDGTDFDSDFTTFNITAAAAELTGVGDLTSNNLTITATDDSESISIADDGSIAEASENGEVITVTLSGGTYASSLSPGNWTVSNLPGGVTAGNPVRASATSATITLSGNRTQDYDTDITNLTVTITAAEVDDHSGADLSDATGVTFTATNDPENFSMASDGSIVEGAEDGEVITVSLSGGTFVNPLTAGFWILANEPTGVSIGSVVWSSPSEAIITLSGNRTVDYESDITNLQITAAAVEVDDETNPLSVNTGVTFTAVDDAESISIADDGSIIEGAENGEVITVTLIGGTYASSLTGGNWTVTNLPTGVSAGSPVRESETSATITLSGNASADYDSDITNLTVSITAAEVDIYTGAALSDNDGVTFTASYEPVITVSTTSLTHFGNVQTGSSSTEQSFTVEGDDLNGDITITPPTGFEISTGTGGSFVPTNPITLTRTGRDVSTTNIYVKFTPTIAAETSGNITHTSTGATTKNVAVAGTGTTAGASSNVAITELADHHLSADYDYIEIYNAGNASANIDGYVLKERPQAGTTGESSFTLSSARQGNDGGSNYLTLEPGEYAIICRSSVSTFEGNFSGIGDNVAIFSSLGYGGIPNIDGLERYQLEGTAKAVLDNFGDWDDEGVFSVTVGKSFERSSASSDGEVEGSWSRTTSESYGYTPGGFNNNPLPIELISFKATVVGDIINIEWLTISETNNDFFTVEKSIDAESFEALENIPGAGNSNDFNYYSIKDENPAEGINYYRLKQTDFDGEVSISDITSVCLSSDLWTIDCSQPYSDGNFINSELYGYPYLKVKIEIIDVLGKVYYSTYLNVNQEKKMISINAENLKKGVYFFRVMNDDNVVVKKFVF